MNQTIQLKMSRYPKAMARLLHSNQFLKMFSAATLGISLLLLLGLLSLIGQPPVVVTLSEKGMPLTEAAQVNAEDHIRSALNQYLSTRYTWTPETVREQLNHTKAFILSKNLKAFQSASLGIQKFASERSVSQKLYPGKVEVSMGKSVALVRGDRVTTIQGLKAAGDLKLELTFEAGPRTKENPWGIYITKEKEE